MKSNSPIGKNSERFNVSFNPASPWLHIGKFTRESIVYFQQVMEKMKSDGCDAVILGCTEIPLIMNDSNSPLPTLDSTRLLARAALYRAAGDKKVCSDA